MKIFFFHFIYTPFKDLYKEYKDEITVIAIHEAGLYEEDPEGVKEFIDNQFGDYDILFGYDSLDDCYYEALGGMGTFPATMIVDQDGFVHEYIITSLTEDILRSKIENLLNK